MGEAKERSITNLIFKLQTKKIKKGGRRKGRSSSSLPPWFPWFALSRGETHKGVGKQKLKYFVRDVSRWEEYNGKEKKNEDNM